MFSSQPLPQKIISVIYCPDLHFGPITFVYIMLFKKKRWSYTLHILLYLLLVTISNESIFFRLIEAFSKYYCCMTRINAAFHPKIGSADLSYGPLATCVC